MVIAPYLETTGLFSEAIPKLKHLFFNAPSDSQVRIIYIVADLLRNSRHCDLNEAVPAAEQTWKWAVRLGGDNRAQEDSAARTMFVRTWNQAKQPFYEVRVASFHLLEAIATQVI